METKYCNFCKLDHNLTSEFWYKIGNSHQCKSYHTSVRKKNAEKNRARNRQASKEWKEKHPGYMAKAAQKYYQNNKEKVISGNYKYVSTRKKTDTGFRLSILLRQRLNRALKGKYKAGSAVSDLGCSIEEFKLYLESKFQTGMTWETMEDLDGT